MIKIYLKDSFWFIYLKYSLKFYQDDKNDKFALGFPTTLEYKNCEHNLLG